MLGAGRGPAEQRELVVSGEREVRETLDRAIEAALAAPYPDPETDGATEFAT